MILDNGILHLELVNKGGEMASLTYKGMDILYKGDGEFWAGKNPTLFPMISSPDTKKYIYDGKEYTCRNHGLIRYSTLDTVIDDGKQVTMSLVSSEDTKKEYPFDFEYRITYILDNNKVLISYDITNRDNKVMPFTFGLHPGFIVRDFDEVELIFAEDETGIQFNQKQRSEEVVKLSPYSGKQYLADLARLQTVIYRDLKSKFVKFKTKEYSVNIDMSKFRYLGLWSPNENAGFMCIEPWLSKNDIEPAENAFDPSFELEYLKPNEIFKIDYYIEIND